MDFINGEILYIDKPLEWTSFDAVKCLRSTITRRLKLKKLKVGHAGTLDPLATGLIIITTGRATRQIESLQAGEKEYIATIALGATTPSFDLETPVDATYPTDHITRELVIDTLPRFIGTITQTPPEFSAIKIDGQRAYNLARRGRPVDMPVKTLVISEIELLDYQPTQLTLRIACSKGTYIRALARDLGQALNTGAHLTALRRTRIGDATVSRALTIPQAIELIKTASLQWPEWFLREHPNHLEKFQNA